MTTTSSIPENTMNLKLKGIAAALDTSDGKVMFLWIISTKIIPEKYVKNLSQIVVRIHHYYHR